MRRTSEDVELDISATKPLVKTPKSPPSTSSALNKTWESAKAKYQIGSTTGLISLLFVTLSFIISAILLMKNMTGLSVTFYLLVGALALALIFSLWNTYDSFKYGSHLKAYTMGAKKLSVVTLGKTVNIITGILIVVSLILALILIFTDVNLKKSTLFIVLTISLAVSLIFFGVNAFYTNKYRILESRMKTNLG